MIVWRNGDLNDLRTTLAARGAGGRVVVTEIVTDIIEEASERMRHTIDTTPSAFVPGKNNRNDTYHMRRSVGEKPVVSSGNQVSGEWGWTKDLEDYFLYQENGAAPHRKVIPPMHALLGSFLWAREELSVRLQALAKG